MYLEEYSHWELRLRPLLINLLNWRVQICWLDWIYHKWERGGGEGAFPRYGNPMEEDGYIQDMVTQPPSHIQGNRGNNQGRGDGKYLHPIQHWHH